jgi:hypothetical protein
LLPAYDVAEVHSAWVRASPERVFQALREVTAGEVPMFRVLMRIRGLPTRVLSRRPFVFDRRTPLLDQFLRAGFVLLAEEPGRELVVGRIAQFWKPVGASSVPVRSAPDFIEFDNPGYAKAVVNFWVNREGVGTRLRTETRVAATDAASRVKFSRYWLLVRLGSGLTRRSWLKAVRRAAERQRP